MPCVDNHHGKRPTTTCSSPRPCPSSIPALIMASIFMRTNHGSPWWDTCCLHTTVLAWYPGTRAILSNRCFHRHDGTACELHQLVGVEKGSATLPVVNQSTGGNNGRKEEIHPRCIGHHTPQATRRQKLRLSSAYLSTRHYIDSTVPHHWMESGSHFRGKWCTDL